MVIDCFSRRVVGWSIADYIRSERVVDALQMAIWNRRSAPGAIHHYNKPVLHPPVESGIYTGWAFGTRLREARLLGSMGSIGDCFDNAVAESLACPGFDGVWVSGFWCLTPGGSDGTTGLSRRVPAQGS